jgi:hypothetical protein
MREISSELERYFSERYWFYLRTEYNYLFEIGNDNRSREEWAKDKAIDDCISVEL